MPDDRLLASADSGALGDRTKVEAEVRRMIADPRALDGFQSFHRQWLGVPRIETAQKDAKLYPEWTPALRASMKRETQLFVEDLFRSDASFRTLLTAPYGFVDAALGALYGATGAPASGFARVMLPDGQRSGVLTQATFLAVQALPDQPSPIHRGLFIRERLLCSVIPPPPTGVDIVPPKVDPNLSVRQRFEQHRRDPLCASCHQLMDPIGFGLQAYDSIGRYRAMDGKFPVDATGEITGVASDVDGTFDGPVELSRKLAGSRTAQTCMARQWMRFALGRLETDREACVVEQIASRFGGARLDLRELLVAVATSDTFRTR
jgi:hypothetical protein